jgi:hypothetical protein
MSASILATTRRWAASGGIPDTVLPNDMIEADEICSPKTRVSLRQQTCMDRGIALLLKIVKWVMGTAVTGFGSFRQLPRALLYFRPSWQVSAGPLHAESKA